MFDIFLNILGTYHVPMHWLLLTFMLMILNVLLLLFVYNSYK